MAYLVVPVYLGADHWKSDGGGGGGGEAKAKIKIEQGKQEKKIRARKKLKKKFVQKLFNRENYKLCKGGPQLWKIKRFLIQVMV